MVHDESFNARIDEMFDRHLEVVVSSRAALVEGIAEFAATVTATLLAGGTVFAAGNGGSAADAQHFVAELVGRFGTQRDPLRAVALGSDAATTSAIANDFGYEHGLAREAAALIRPGDLLVAISTSGDSRNVVLAAEAARTTGGQVIGLTGASGGALATKCDSVLRVPSESTPRIQEVHALVLHAVAELVESDAVGRAD